MLMNNFYTIQTQAATEQSISVIINIHPGHEIFKGHFPQNPVVPGVCMIQIVKELLEQQIEKPLLFQKGNQIKFLQLLVPNKDEKIGVNISWKEMETGFQTVADFKKDSIPVFKLNGIFSLLPLQYQIPEQFV